MSEKHDTSIVLVAVGEASAASICDALEDIVKGPGPAGIRALGSVDGLSAAEADLPAISP